MKLVSSPIAAPAAPLVVLTPDEWLHACMVGCTRQIDNLRGKRQDRYGADERDGWKIHIEGACGELALAKHLGQYWSGALGNLKAADVGPLQVRTAESDTDSLILHPPDDDEAVFVLLTGVAPRFRIRGWISGRDGKRERFWKDPRGGRPAFFVPQSVLTDVAVLSL